jgi:hypothetical protein
MDILAFCRKRNISTDGIRIRQIVEWNRKHTDRSKVLLKITLPDHFPPKYDKTIGKTVAGCLVAKLGEGIGPATFESVIKRMEKS